MTGKSIIKNKLFNKVVDYLWQHKDKVYVRGIVRWSYMAVLSLVVSLLAYPLAPVIAFLSLSNTEGRVPSIFDWWLTDDNSIDGDFGHHERHPGDTKKATWIRRTTWLWRNKGYTFDSRYLAAVVGPELTTHGNRLVSDRPFVPGWFFEYDENGVWQFYLIAKYPFFKQKCIRIRLGWKIKQHSYEADVEVARIATSVGLFRSYLTNEQFEAALEKEAKEKESQ